MIGNDEKREEKTNESSNEFEEMDVKCVEKDRSSDDF